MATNAKIIEFQLDKSMTWIDIYVQMLCGSIITLLTTSGEKVKFVTYHDMMRTDIESGGVHFEAIEVCDEGKNPKIATRIVGVLYCDERRVLVHPEPPPVPSEYQNMLNLITQMMREESARAYA